MHKLLNLSQLGGRLAKVDMMLMALLKRRMDLALQVGEYKISKAEKIFRAKIESKRLAQVRIWARKNKMNPHFAETVLYTIIGESCKQQMIQLQNITSRKKKKGKTPAVESEWQKSLDRNLLVLAKRWSKTYDTDYDKAFFATHDYLAFENEVLEQELRKLSNRYVFLDLGCATGRLTFQFAGRFERVIGYDVSQDMIVKAKKRANDFGVKNASFGVVDIQKGIPEPDNSVSFAVMNLGTASDIREISGVLKEIGRVLVPHGRFLLSFYNVEALRYRWDFIPWSTGLAAELNSIDECLDVHLGNRTLSVYAKPYSVSEISDLVRGKITIDEIQTYPTLSAILPNDLFENQPEVQKSIMMMDKQLADSTLNGGAYIVVTGQKTG